MIHGRITAKAQTTIPRAVRVALGVKPGDDVVWELEGDRAVVRRAASDEPDMIVNNISTFAEWGDELDAVFDEL